MRKNLLLITLLLSAVFIQAQNFEWAKQMGGNGIDNGFDFKTDSNGFVYSTGNYSDSSDLDPGPGVYFVSPDSLGGINLYVNKFDNSGGFYWAKKIDNATGRSLDVDASGNVYIGGSFGGPYPVDFDPGPGSHIVFSASPTIPDYFLLKLDNNGNFQWVKTFRGVRVHSIALDSAGDLYSGGYFSDTVDLDPGPSTLTHISTGMSDGCILKLDPSGNLVWAEITSGAGDEVITSICISASQKLYMTGYFSGTADFAPGLTLTSAGWYDAMILKMNTSGTMLWAKSIGGSAGQENGSDISADSVDNVYITGSFTGTVDMDPGSGVSNLHASASTDAYVLKLSPGGSFIYSGQIGGTGTDAGRQVAATPDGKCYWSGIFSGSVDLDPGMGIQYVTSSGAQDLFFSGLDQAGSFLWSRQIPGGGYEDIRQLSVDDQEDIFIMGTYEDTTLFEAGNSSSVLYPHGYNEIYYVKFSSDSCSALSLTIDSIADLTCLSPGFSSAHALNGLQPFNYLWNTVPATNDSAAIFTSPGIYELDVTDANGCTRSTAIVVNGPGPLSGFDLNADFIATDFRVGFPSTVWLDAFNDRCAPVTGSLQIILDTLVIFNSSSPAPDLVNGDTLTWNFTSLTYDSLHITPQISLTTPVWAAIGDTMDFVTIINPAAGDAVPSNNTKNYSFAVINGYDPNDKSVYPAGTCTEAFIKPTELLTYKIRFQNTGNASAINIVLLDTLDSDLDPSTLRVLSSSHPLITEILPGNVLRFRFDGINLADSTSDEPNSHGYVFFEITPDNSLANGDVITNQVGIYFDFNPPVYTNTVLNTISDGALNTGTSVSMNTVTALASDLSYQWLDCDSAYSIIPSANAQNYIVSHSGNYAVQVSDGCFNDTSACVFVAYTGIHDLADQSGLSVYPNPGSDNITVRSSLSTVISIRNLLGETVITAKVNGEQIIDISSLSSGIYFIQTSEGTGLRLVKN